jgi:hypothetical protein
LVYLKENWPSEGLTGKTFLPIHRERNDLWRRAGKEKTKKAETNQISSSSPKTSENTLNNAATVEI